MNNLNKRGFSLAETLISMALLMIAIFVFAPIFAMSLKQISYAGNWQNIIIRQRAEIEQQIASRKAVLSDAAIDIESVDITLHDEEGHKYSPDIIIGKIISDTLGNRSYIKSFLSDIYPTESLNGSVPDTGNDAGIIITPQTIYYGEDLHDKIFTLQGKNITFIEESTNRVMILGNDGSDKTDQFNISYHFVEDVGGTIKIAAKSGIPDDMFKFAPFTIKYNDTYKTQITVLPPQIIAVTNKGEFITGYRKNDDIIFSKVIGKLSSNAINKIIYNFQKREYVAAGNSNLFSAFVEKPDRGTFEWVDSYTTNFSTVNNNYSVAVDWLNNYMIGSSYLQTTKNNEVEVFLSEKDRTYAFKSIFLPDKNNGAFEVTALDAKWFDILRTTLFVKTFDNNYNLIDESAVNYIIALGHYNVTTKNKGTVNHDLLFAKLSDMDAEWFDISDPQGSPSNTSPTPLYFTGVTCGIGTYIQQDENKNQIKITDYSILLACTKTGELFGVVPNKTTGPVLGDNNTDWVPVNHGITGITSLKSIAYGNEKFVAVGSGSNNIIIGTANATESMSSDIQFGIDISWKEYNISGAVFNEVRFINHNFYAVGELNKQGVIYRYKPETDKWEKLNTPVFEFECVITSIAGE